MYCKGMSRMLPVFLTPNPFQSLFNSSQPVSLSRVRVYFFTKRSLLKKFKISGSSHAVFNIFLWMTSKRSWSQGDISEWKLLISLHSWELGYFVVSKSGNKHWFVLVVRIEHAAGPEEQFRAWLNRHNPYIDICSEQTLYIPYRDSRETKLR